jgi:hypothetical protein
VLAIPILSLAVVKAEIVQLLGGRQAGPGVLLQQPLQGGGAALLNADPEEIRQPACHGSMAWVMGLGDGRLH